MLQYFETLQDESGNALAGATLTVTAFPGGGAATIYSSNSTTAPILNSLVGADVTGQVSFFIPDGAYILTYANAATVYKIKSPVQMLDPMGFVVATDTGTLNALVVNSSAYPVTLYVGLKIQVKAAITTTGAATFNLNATGAQALTYPGGGALGAGVIQANGIYTLQWDGTEWQVQNGNIASAQSFTNLTVGPPASGTGFPLTVLSSTGWGAATMNSTLQLTGPGKLTNANQVVTTTQLMLHGLSAEMVWINGAAGADLKVWSDFVDSSGVMHKRIENDALTATADYMTVTRSGAFTGNQVTLSFPIGFGSVTIAPTASNAYQMVINAGATAGFANGLQIKAGSNSGDNALNIIGQSGAAFGNVSGQNQWTISPVTLTGLIGLTVVGVASSSSPVATFGGTASNFITVTDGAGMTLVMQTSTGVGSLVGPSSNHALQLQTNNIVRASIGAGGGLTVVGSLSCNNVSPPAQITGWGTPTGAAVENNFSGSAAPLTTATAAIAKIITDLKSFGLYAA